MEPIPVGQLAGEPACGGLARGGGRRRPSWGLNYPCRFTVGLVGVEGALCELVGGDHAGGRTSTSTFKILEFSCERYSQAPLVRVADCLAPGFPL